MAVKPRLSIMGLYNFDSTIFDGLIVPDGVSVDAVIDEVVTESAPFDCLYPNADFFKRVLTRFSSQRLPIWQKLYNTTVLEYNPIENYDRIEERTSRENYANTGGSSVHDTNNPAKDKLVTTVTTSNTAFNSDNFKDTTKDVTEESPSVDRTSTTVNNDSGTREEGEQSRIHGNVGVTTSQQMIQSERDLVTFDIVRFIAEDIINKFCVEVY